MATHKKLPHPCKHCSTTIESSRMYCDNCHELVKTCRANASRVCPRKVDAVLYEKLYEEQLQKKFNEDFTPRKVNKKPISKKFLVRGKISNGGLSDTISNSSY